MPSLAEAITHHQAGRLKQAARDYGAILQQQPRHADALHLLGLVAHQCGNDPGAEALIRQAIAIAPQDAAYPANLGVVLLRMRRAAEAASVLRTALQLQPGDARSHANLGVALWAAGDHTGAAASAAASLRLRPDDPATRINLGIALEAAGRYGEALVAFGSVDSNAAHLARGALLLVMGRTAGALDAMDTAIRLDPSDITARQARIMAMNYLPGATMAQIGDVARRLAPAAAGKVGLAGLDRSPGRRLRIGYVSADFRNHPVGYFLHAALAARDQADANIICYDAASKGDGMTARLQATADGWRAIAALDDAQAASAIRADGIDILVDLGGHTRGNRLGVFAQRAAPIQASWLGYCGTTGMPAMDWVIADNHVLPPSDEPSVTERVVRLPGSLLCFSPPPEAGPVTPRGDGPITFGCFNNRAKLNPAVFDLWARILAAVPDSRLLLKSAQCADAEVREEITRAFPGIAPGRILFELATPIAAMFDAYNRVDIALDTFPFAGGTTTAQALWMGVPVISLTGETWSGRQGASILSAAGYPEWAVADEDAYAALAQTLAANHRMLAELRARLRDTVAASPLCRAKPFARHLQQAYRGMWHHFLSR